MKSNNENSKAIAAYLAGELSDAEKQRFEQWINESNENQEVFREALIVWKNSGKKLFLNDETELQWTVLKSRIESSDKRGKILSIFNLNPVVLKIAASFIILVGVSYIFFSVFNKEITISAGNEVATVYLPDSTRVWLNTNSKLIYPKSFEKQKRSTKLEGEGYFEVKSDKASVFTVSTGNTVTEVVGTAFNIKEEKEDVVLTVSEGTVKFSPTDEPNNKSVTVNAQEKAVIKGKGKIQKAKNTDPDFASWRTLNNPQFEKEKLSPNDYLTTAYAWRKNQINQSVIEGTLTNNATLAGYKNIVLKVTYTKPNGKTATARVTVTSKVKAGETIRYQKRLLDILTDTQSLQAEIESAEVIK